MTEVCAESIRAYRLGAGLTIAEAARALSQESPYPLPAMESVIRSWKRWEAGTRPSRSYRDLLITMLDGPAPMAGDAEVTVSLGGDWWAAWQSYFHGQEHIDYHQVRVRQNRSHLRFWAITRARPVEEGGYLWTGEMRLWGNETLMGWYVADDGSVRSKGTVYFAVHPHGQSMKGRWVGLSHDGDNVTGFGAMARSRETTEMVMNEMLNKESRGTDR